MLRGHATARLDDKGRLRIPAEFLDVFLGLCGGDRRVFITSRDGQMARVYPLPVWEEHERKLLEAPSMNKGLERYLRVVNYWGKETQVDASGRVLLHPLLRGGIKLDADASVFGRQTFLEICPAEVFSEQPPTVSEDELNQLSETLGL